MEKKMEYEDNQEAETKLEELYPELMDALLNFKSFGASIFLLLDPDNNEHLKIYAEMMGGMSIDSAERLLTTYQSSVKMNVEGELTVDAAKKMLVIHQDALLKTLNNTENKEE